MKILRHLPRVCCAAPHEGEAWHKKVPHVGVSYRAAKGDVNEVDRGIVPFYNPSGGKAATSPCTGEAFMKILRHHPRVCCAAPREGEACVCAVPLVQRGMFLRMQKQGDCFPYAAPPSAALTPPLHYEEEALS